MGSNIFRNFTKPVYAQDGDNKNPETLTAEASKTAEAQTQTAQAGVTPPAVVGTPTAVPTETPITPEKPAATNTMVTAPTSTTVLTPTPSPLVSRTIENATKRGARDAFNNTVTYVNGIPYVDQDALNRSIASYNVFYPNSGVNNFAYDQSMNPPTQFPDTLGNLKWDDNSTVFRPAYDKDQSMAVAQNLITYMKTGSKGDGTPLTSNKDSKDDPIQPTDFPPEVLQEIAYQASGNALRGFSREGMDKINTILTAKKQNAKIQDAAKQKIVADEVSRVGDWGLLAGDSNTDWFGQNVWNDLTHSYNDNSPAYDVARIQNANNALSIDRTRAAVLKPIQQTAGAMNTPDDAAQGTAFARITPKTATITPLPTTDPSLMTANTLTPTSTSTRTRTTGGGTNNSNGNTTITTNGSATAASDPFTSNGARDKGVVPRDDTLQNFPRWTDSVPYLNNAYRNGASGSGSKENPLILPIGMSMPQDMIDEWRKVGRYIQNPNISVVPNTGPTRTPLNPNVPTGPNAINLQNTAIANENNTALSQTAQARSGNYVQTATPTPTINSRFNPDTRRVWPSGGSLLTLNPNTSQASGNSSQIITTTPTQSRTVQPTQTPTQSRTVQPTQTALPSPQTSLDNAQQEIAQILNEQRLNQQLAASAYPQFAPKNARMSPSKKTKKLKKDIGVGTGLTAHATQPVPESPMPKIRTSYGSYKFKKPQQQRSAKYGEDQQIYQPMRKQINAVQPRQTMQNVMQFPPSDGFQSFAKMIINPIDKYEKNDLTKSLQQNSKYNNAYSNKKYEK